MRVVWLALILTLTVAFMPLRASANEEDIGFITRILQDQLSDAGREVRIIGFEGALSSRATMREMTIADDDGVWLTLSGAVLDWNRAALFRGAVVVRELAADSIVLHRMPRTDDGPDLPSPEARDFALPELPVSIRIDRLQIERLSIGAPVLGEAVEATIDGFAELEGGAGTARLEGVRLDGPQGLLRLEGNFDNATRFLQIDLRLEEDADGVAVRLLDVPGRPAAELAVVGQGPLSDFAADILLATDGVPRLEGGLTLRTEADGAGGSIQRFGADLAGNLAPLLSPTVQPFFGDSVSFTARGASFPDGRLAVEALDLTTGKLRLTGMLRLGPDRLPEVLALSGVVAAPDGGPATLPVAGGGVTVRRAEIALDFDAARGPDWDARFVLDDLRTPDFAAARLALTGAGQLGDNGAASLDADLRFDATGLAPVDPGLARALGSAVSGRANLFWTEGGSLALRSMTLAGQDFALTGAGQVRGTTLAGRIEARLGALERFSTLAGRDLSGSLRGLIEGEATLITGAFDLSARLTGQDLRLGQDELDGLLAGTSQIAASVRRDTSGTTIRFLDAEARTLSARIEGRIATGASDLTARLDFSDLSVLGEGYRGALAGTAGLVEDDGTQRVTAQMTGQDVAIGVPEVDGLLQGGIVVTADVARSGQRIDVAALRIVARDLTLDAQGRVAPGDSNLRADLRLADLSVLGPRYGGALAAEAHYTANPTHERLQARADGRDLAVGVPEADRLLRGAASIVLDASRGRDGVVALRDLTVSAANMRANARGRVAPGNSDLEIGLDLPDLGVLGPRYRGRLVAFGRLAEQGSRRSVDLDAQATALAVGVPQVDALLRGATALRLVGSEQDGRVRIERFNLTNPQLTAQATGDPGRPGRLTIFARLADLGLLAPGVAGALSVNGTLEEVPAGYTLDLTVDGPSDTRARVAGTVAPDFTRVDIGLAGSADLALANPSLRNNALLGRVDFDLRVNGLPVLASVSGRASTSGAQVFSPRQMIRVEDVNAVAVLSGGGRAAVEGTATLGGGRISAQGSVGVLPPFQTDLVLTADGVGLTDRRIFDTTVSGTLSVTGPAQTGGLVRGAVTLGPTELRIPSTGLGGSGYIPPMRHIAEPADVNRTRAAAGLLEGRGDGGPLVPWALDLTVSAPNRVFLRGRGIDAEMGGTLRLGGTNVDVVPAGEFSLIRGRLDLLGRRFVFSDGLARLQGRFVPFVRLVASTSSRDLTAQIIVEGEADALDLRFTSVPDLPDEEILARLLFGQELGRLSAFQAAQLASAVATLAGRGGDGIVGNLRSAFGFADFDITSDSRGNAAVRLGSYLTENIYTDLTVDSTGRSEVSVNLDLSPSVTVRARTDSDGRSGLGVFFERDY